MSSLAEDLVVVGLDPAKGRILLGNHTTYLVEAAIVVDLVAAGRLCVTGSDARSRILVADPTPVAHPVLDRTLTWCVNMTRPPTEADRAELRQAGWLTRKVATWALARERPGVAMDGGLDGLDAWRLTLDHLVATGVLEVRDHRSWTLTTSPRYTATPLARRDELVDHLRGVLVDGLEPDDRARRLLGLLGASHILSSALLGASHLARWAPRQRRDEIAARAVELGMAEADEGVRVAIEAAAAVIDRRAEKASRTE